MSYEDLLCSYLELKLRLHLAVKNNDELRECLNDTRREICLGRLSDVLWHSVSPACSTVQNITNVLKDGQYFDQSALTKQVN